MADRDKDQTYDPSQVEATRAREQGQGAGQRDMDLQRDANREQPSFQSTQDYDADPDEPAAGGAQHGQDRTKWEGKDETWGQGPKTLAKQREQNRRAT
jgi:hypothetical protein